MRYEVKVTPGSDGKIVREVDIVQDRAKYSCHEVRETITRQVIDTMEAGTRKALEQLGWTAPIVGDVCIVKGCYNMRAGGEFVGNLCKPCYRMVTTGEEGNHAGLTFIHELHRRVDAANKAAHKAASVPNATLNLAPPIGNENPLGQERRVNAAYVLELERALREAKNTLMSIRI